MKKGNNTLIEFGSLTDSSFAALLATQFSESKKIVLVDENTHKHCLNILLNQFEALSQAEVIVIPNGEINKTMDVVMQVCLAFKEYEIGRKDVLINLGGGMVTDIGGFIASIYNRGISCIHIPTTLLGMVDASIGAKTAVDLESAKNLLGTFYQPVAVYIDDVFLATLPEEEWNNGLAEMLKHALISDKELWDQLSAVKTAQGKINLELIRKCASIKINIVHQDPWEKNQRRYLNFGHTVGHALEAFFMQSKSPLSHGHAVALGMISESYLSMKVGAFSEKEFMLVLEFLAQIYPLVKRTEINSKEVLTFARLDKKNTSNKMNVVLLKSIGNVDGVYEVADVHLLESLTYISE